MIFRETTYSVLIVSSTDKFIQTAQKLLPSCDFWPVNTASNAGEARRAATELQYDLIIINTPLSDEFGTQFASDISQAGNGSVLLFVKSELYENIYSKVLSAGVMVISKPTSAQMITHTLRLMCASREKLRSMESKQATVEEKIMEIRIVNKAKWLLIDRLGMTEDEAHRFIEKQAMDLRISKKSEAENIILTYS